MGQETPGLRRRKRKGGSDALYWCATAEAVKAGFMPRTVNLSMHRDAPALLSSACKRLDAEQRAWLSGKTRDRSEYTGTFSSLFQRYEKHPESSFQNLKPSSRRAYIGYLTMLDEAIGKRRVTAVAGVDIIGWHKRWKAPDKPGGPEKLAAAAMAAAVLKAALAFGVLDGNRPGCKDLHYAMSLMEFPKPRPRRQAPTAEQIAKARAAAHEMGNPRLALAYAIQFETTLRLWDVVGQWVPVNEPGVSAYVAKGQKWFGLTWADIDENLILRVKASKTDGTTEAVVSFDLSQCPMVMEEIAKIPDAERTGPVILNGKRPYWGWETRNAWREIAKDIGVSGVWNRDIRAGGITAARKAGANLDDVSKVAGHSGKAITAKVYDRDTVESHRRVRRAIAGTPSGTRDNGE
jgi:integrase